MNNAIITGGAFHNQNFFQVCNGKFKNIFKEQIYILDLHSTDLSKYDYIVIASRLNPKILTQNKAKFEEYLQNGGHIISFGDIMGDHLPSIDFTPTQVNFWWWIHPGADLPMYAYDSSDEIWNFLKLQECKWHYHGVFNPPKYAKKIIVDEIGKTILYKDSYSFAGNMYITSLDPDYHIGQGFMPITIVFLEKFIAWVEYDIKNGAKI
ncbi:hypothetical protein [Campylobacter devanensis]|uniref:hypothetical protein n=1 Tax=Campylobacter devanensis TaxID=3161138 RepID=UPI000A35025B|nr:hypothetical protein [Campylobacter sp. P0107]